MSSTTSGNSASGSLAVCNGRHIQFVWVNANYANECSYTFTDVNDDVIFSGHGALAAPVDYTVDCLVSSCKKPKDLALTSIPGPRSVELRWTPGTSDQDAWQICVNGDEANLVNVTTNPFTLTGLEPETTYTVKIRGNCGVEKSGWSNEVTFTTDIPCPVPTNVYAAEIGPNTATLNWTCVNNSFDVRYGELVESSDNTVASWLQYDNSTISTNIGSSNGGTWTWGVKYTDNLVTGKRLTKVSIFESSEHTSSDITINIYEGGDDAPETLIHTQVVKPVANDTFHEVELSSPVNITRGKNLWITLTATGTYVMAACLATEANNQWISNQGEWTNMANLNAKLAVYGWMIRACMEVPEVDFDAIVWTTAAATGSTYELTGLQPLTNYVAQVRGNYGADGNSEWETTRFITIVANPIAKDVNVVAAQTAANISWKGYSDSYKVRYRTSLKENTSFFDDFEDDLDQWTIYTEGDTPFPKGWVIYDSGVASQGYVASAWSWYDYTAYDASNWLVTPQLSLRGNLKFKEYVNAKYPDKYEVLLSTTGNAINDFTITLREMAASAGNWGEVNIDLSNYEGQQGYIAIHHRDSDYNYLYIDDFGIFLEPTPASNWTEIVTNETNVTLTGLTPGTKYDFQIIGITDGAENAGTDIASFTTIDGSQNVDIDLADNADNSTTLSTYRGQSANVTLSGRRFYTNGTWNTLCLPFDLNAAQLAESSIAGATVKELDIAAGTYPHVTAVDKGTLYLNFKEVTSIEAGKPYIAKLTDTSEYLDDPTFSGVVIPDTYTDAAAITAALADKAVTSTDGKVTFLGTYTPVTYNAEDKSVVFLSDGGTVNYLWANGQKTYTLNAFRAYFQVNPSASTYVLNFGDGETTTGICDNEATRSDDDTWYDMSGRKVANRQSINRTLPKGVYVKNGRKIVVK